MDALAGRYLAAVLSCFEGEVGDRLLLPTVLTLACVDVLGVDGAGLSLVDTLRVPLAASDEEVRRAERLQTTLGEGPCLSAVAAAEPLVAGQVSMATRWPTYYRELVEQTSFRSVAALPLALPGERPFAALDCYLKGSEPDPSLIEAPLPQDLAHVITMFLRAGPLTSVAWTSEPVAAWLDRGSVADRMNVWTAVGMVMDRTEMNQPDSLAWLRAYAFSHDSTVDEVAQLLTTSRLPLDQLVG
jgi:hypothetical protein